MADYFFIMSKGRGCWLITRSSEIYTCEIFSYLLSVIIRKLYFTQYVYLKYCK